MSSPAHADAGLGERRRRRPLQTRVGGLPPAFWWLWVGTLVNRAGSFIEPFAILYLTGPRHLSIATAGTVVTIWGVGSIGSQPLGGYLTDRVGRRRTLALGMFALGGALAVLASARGLWWITAAAFLVGVVGDVYRPAASATVADLLMGEQRTRGFALQFWAINLGFAFAAASAGLLLHVGFVLLFVLDALTCVAFGVVVFVKVPETRPANAKTDHDDRAWRELARDPILIALTSIVLVAATLYGQVYVAVPLAVRAAGLSAGAYGLIMAVNGVVIVVVQPLALPMITRWRPAAVLPVSMILVGVGIGLSAFCHSVTAFAATVVVWTLGEIGQASCLQAQVAELAPERLRGRYFGVIGLAWGASAVLAPFLGSRLYAAEPNLVWCGCALLGLVAAGGHLALSRAIGHRAAIGSDDSSVPSTG